MIQKLRLLLDRIDKFVIGSDIEECTLVQILRIYRSHTIECDYSFFVLLIVFQKSSSLTQND